VQKGNIIHRWKEPKEVTAHLFRKSIQMGKDFVPRALLIVSIILILSFLFLNNLAPEEIFRPLARRLILVFLCMCFLISVGFVHPILDRLFGTKYTITNKKIVKSSIGSPKVIYWKNVTGYSLCEEEEFPDVISITVYSNRFKTVLWLPKGELSSQVITTFTERCPLITESEDDQFSGITLSDSVYFHLFILSLIYSFVVAYLVFPYRSWRLIKLIWLITIVLGPGTFGCLFFYGWKTLKKTVIRHALFLNWFAFFFFSLCLVLLELHHWSKIIKELEGK